LELLPVVLLSELLLTVLADSSDSHEHQASGNRVQMFQRRAECHYSWNQRDIIIALRGHDKYALDSACLQPICHGISHVSSMQSQH